MTPQLRFGYTFTSHAYQVHQTKAKWWP